MGQLNRRQIIGWTPIRRDICQPASLATPCVRLSVCLSVESVPNQSLPATKLAPYNWLSFNFRKLTERQSLLSGKSHLMMIMIQNHLDTCTGVSAPSFTTVNRHLKAVTWCLTVFIILEPAGGPAIAYQLLISRHASQLLFHSTRKQKAGHVMSGRQICNLGFYLRWTPHFRWLLALSKSQYCCLVGIYIETRVR